jgi:hypothetical protein
MSPYLFLIPVAITYLVLVRVLRYSRITTLQKQHGFTPSTFSNLNYRDAQTIIGQLVSLPTPFPPYHSNINPGSLRMSLDLPRRQRLRLPPRLRHPRNFQGFRRRPRNGRSRW